jgi:hypothetical protein
MFQVSVFDQATNRIDVFATPVTRESLALAEVTLSIAMTEHAVTVIGVWSVFGDRNRIAV